MAQVPRFSAVNASLPVRFWDRVVRRGPDECWPSSATPAKRYPQLTYQGAIYPLHRLAWELHYGAIPVGQHVRHKCDNTRCCNPAHLELGEHADNMRDMATRGRHGRLRLTPDQVREIRQSTGTVRELAEQFGVSKSQIHNIRCGKQQNHIS